MISEEQLKKATLEADEILMAAQTDLEACDHEFSPAFERKMKKLIWRRKHPVLIHPLFRVAAAVLVMVLLCGAVLSVPEVRAGFVGLFSEEKEHRFRYELSGYVKEEDLKAYHLGYVPEGYTLVEEMNYKYHGKRNFRHEDDSAIVFNYYIQKEGGRLEQHVSFVSTDYEITDTIVDGRGADLFISRSSRGNVNRILVWKNEEHSVLFIILCTNPSVDIEAIAESVFARIPEE